MKRPDHYDPELNPTYADLARHYGGGDSGAAVPATRQGEGRARRAAGRALDRRRSARIGVVREFFIKPNPNNVAINDLIDQEVKKVLRDKIGASC